MKTKKKAGQESSLSCRFFLVFPGCSASGWRRSAAGPWCGGCAAINSQNIDCSLANRSLRVFCDTGKLSDVEQLTHPVPGPGAMPLVGWRGEALHGSPAPAGNCLFEKPTASATESRANGPCKRKSRGQCDRGLFLFFYYSLISRHFLPVSSAETASG